MNNQEDRLIRIGVFYDGNFFYHVSNYYKYAHPKQRRISIPGMHDFIRNHVSSLEQVDVRYCQIVDAHFFRGRLSAREAETQQKLYAERVFDDILMRERVVTHYLPISFRGEKGVDVWLALEAFDLAVHNRFNFMVLIAGDGDFVPLVRKLNSLGIRVMVLGWDFKYVDESGQERETVTSLRLFDESTYPVLMHSLIDDKCQQDTLLMRSLFVEPRVEGAGEPALWTPPIEATAEVPGEARPVSSAPTPGEPQAGAIHSLQQGYGFIKTPLFPNNIYFHWSELDNTDFDQLRLGSAVTFVSDRNDKGPIARTVRLVD